MTEPALSIRGPVVLGLVAILAMGGGFGLWATQTRLSGAVAAQGQVAVDGEVQPVQHPEGGTVAEVLVREGDTVQAGQVLLRLEGAALQSELRIVEDRLAELAARAARLEAERDGGAAPVFPPALLARAAFDPGTADQIAGQRRLFAARLASLAKTEAQLSRQIAQIEAQARGLKARQAALDRTLALVAEDRMAQEALLAGGLVPRTALLALEREAARLAGEKGELDANLARLAEEVTEVGIEITALQTRRVEEATAELREIGPAQLELAEKGRALADRIARLEVRAPVAGTVLGLKVTAAETVLRPADPAMTIVPRDRPLYVSARVAPVQVRSVVPGQTAELEVVPFARGEALRLAGHVTILSADAFHDPRTGAAFYIARIEIDPAAATPLAKGALMPGMPVQVFLLTESRTPLAYLLRPFATYFARALREP